MWEGWRREWRWIAVIAGVMLVVAVGMVLASGGANPVIPL